ncbi:MAG: hypothetical protein DDT32_02058 [Syntrophomonadaceae bacterium]|nr:hypothetical protein [Bacillota bacterium]MBT9148286.1 hypothetical protein [Bacillota bacterium]
MYRRKDSRVGGVVRRWLPTLFGLAGGFLLYVSLAPVVLSGKNSDAIVEWRDFILQWTQITGYLRLGFVVVAIGFVCLGLLGVVISFLKPQSGARFMLWGGLSSILLLLALWLGILDVHLPIFGSTDIRSALIWDNQWGIGNWKLAKEIIDIGNGWFKPAVAGGAFLVATGIPRWWAHLR